MTTTTRTGEPDLQAKVERLRPVIEQYREQAEQERKLPEPVVTAMRKEGLFNLLLPKEFGGAEIDLPAYFSAIEEISAIDSVAGWNFVIMATGAVQAAFLPEAGAREVFGDGALTAGSVIPAGRAVPVDGGYRLSGRWPLMSGCHHARWIGGNSLVLEGEAPRMLPGGPPDFHIMWFPANECKILDTWYSTGMRGTGSTDVVVEDIFVPEHRAFSLFTAQSRLPGALYRLGIDAHFLTALANVGLGIARASIDAFVRLAKEKTPTLSQTGLAVRPTVHAEVARAEARLQSARSYMREVVSEISDVINSGNKVPEELEARRRLACVNAAESCEQVVDSMYRLGGMTSIYTGHPLDRCLRDLHTVNQHLAVSPVWWEKTGQWYFGLGLGMP